MRGKKTPKMGKPISLTVLKEGTTRNKMSLIKL